MSNGKVKASAIVILRLAGGKILRMIRRPRKIASRLLLALLQIAGVAQAAGPTALPTGGTVSLGQGTINQTGSRMTIGQTTNNLAINWGSFNIGTNAAVSFVQPSSSSVALNRVSDDGGVSQIFGQLSANGRVFLLNPSGILFGPTAQVNVGGLVASSLNLSDSDFATGHYKFSKQGRAGSVINQGRLTAGPGGYVALLAPEVRNEGTIVANSGTVALAGGNAITLDFSGDKLINLVVDQGALNALAENKQLIQAADGTVIMAARAADALSSAVVNNDGLIQAVSASNQNGVIRLEGGTNINLRGQAVGGNSIQVAAPDAVVYADSGTLRAPNIQVDSYSLLGKGELDASGFRGGNVTVNTGHLSWRGGIHADGSAGDAGKISLNATDSLLFNNESVISANSATGQGGSIQLQALGGFGLLSGAIQADGQVGGRIAVTAPKLALLGAQVHADGSDGGGTVLVGGDWHGSGPLAQADRLIVDAKSVITADAVQGGNGGELVIWSQARTDFAGQAFARGGPASGNGGAIEVSSKGQINVASQSKVVALSPNGKAGTVLFDPKDIEIINDPVGRVIDPVSYSFSDNPDGTSKFSPGYINSIVCCGSDVTLQASNDIKVTSPVTISAIESVPGSLTLQAGRSIIVNASISSTGGNLTLIANDRLASGVIDRFRDAGPATITMASGTAISATAISMYGGTISGGTISIDLRDGAGKTNPASGAITLASLSGSQISALNEGLSAGSNIEIVAGSNLVATGPGNALILAGQNFINNAGSSALSANNESGGRWLVYSTTPGLNTFGGIVSPGNLFGRTYSANPPSSISPSLGNRFVYSARPTLEVIADLKTRAYGDTNPALTYEVSGLVPGDTRESEFNGTLASVATNLSHVGSYEITQGSVADQLGYLIHYTGNSFSVTPRPVGLTVADRTRNYGDANPMTGTASVSSGNLVFGDQLSGVSVSSALTSTAHAGTSAALAGNGASPLGGTNGSTAADYRFTYTNGSLTVTPRPVDLTVADRTRNYGDSNPTTGTATVTSGNLVFDDQVSTVSTSTSLPLTAHVGTPPSALSGSAASLSGGTNASTNSDYAFTYVNGLLTVTPRPVTLKVTDQTRLFGDANPTTGTVTVPSGGMVFGDVVTGVVVTSPLTSTAPTGATALLVGSDASLVAGSNGSTNSDYVFKYENGVLGVRGTLLSQPEAGTLLQATQTQIRSPTSLPMPNVELLASPNELVSVVTASPNSLAYAPERFLAAKVERHQNLTDLFKTALDILSRNPSAADLPICDDVPAAADGDLCMPTAAQVERSAGEIKSVQDKTTSQTPPSTPDSSVTAQTTNALVGRATGGSQSATVNDESTYIKRKVAYLIGNNDYKGGIPILDTPISDVGSIATELETKFGYEVHIIKNGTKRDIVRTLQQITQDSSLDDSVLLLYAGHGYEVDDTKQGYWIPTDASTEDPKTWISNSDISKFLTLIRAKQLILVSDSCFSGTLANEQKINKDEIASSRQEILSKRAVLVMTSGGEEPVSDEGKEGHSIFAWSFIKDLQQTNQSRGGVNLYENVRESVLREYPQHPQYGASLVAGHRLGGDYLFEEGARQKESQ